MHSLLNYGSRKNYNEFPLTKAQFEERKQRCSKDFEEWRITSIALTIIACLLAGMGLILMGIGTMPSTMTIGYGVFPYLIGSQVGLLGAGVLLTAFISGCFSLNSYYSKI